MATPAYMHALLRGPRKVGYHVSKKRRQEIIDRDGPVCFYCLKGLDASEITMDHVIPRVRVGTAAAANLRVACMPCNSSKHTRSWPYSVPRRAT